MQTSISHALPRDENPLNLPLQCSEHALTTKTVPYTQSYALTHTLTVAHPVTYVLFRSSMRFIVLCFSENCAAVLTTEKLRRRKSFLKLSTHKTHEGWRRLSFRIYACKSYHQCSITFSEGVT
jgi:hypothetical protein